jgi:hypothetical protein
VEQEIESLKARTASAPDQTAGADLSALLARIEQLEKRPRLNSDKDVFISSGDQHSVGLVPDPGATSGTTAFLREDGTWADIALETNQAYLGVLPDEEQSARGTDDIYQVPGSLHVSGDISVGAATLGDLKVLGSITLPQFYSPAQFYTDFTEVTKTTDNEDFYSHTIPGGVLAVGDMLEYITYADAANATAVNINITVVFNGTEIAFASAGSTVNPTRLKLHAFVLVTGAATQRLFGELARYDGAAGTGVPYLATVAATGNTAGSITATIRLNCSGGTRSVTAYGLSVRRWKAVA